ncbi:MAG: hypothetical protein ACP5M0_07690 [Desulfomonilaceae bacterium]
MAIMPHAAGFVNRKPGLPEFTGDDRAPSAVIAWGKKKKPVSLNGLKEGLGLVYRWV